MRRSDAIQSFVVQETPIVRIYADDGSEGTGYAFTIGTGGSAIVEMISRYLAPEILGRDPARIEEVWQHLQRHTHATLVGPLTSLALSTIDMALWDMRAKNATGGPSILSSAEHSGLSGCMRRKGAGFT